MLLALNSRLCKHLGVRFRLLKTIFLVTEPLTKTTLLCMCYVHLLFAKLTSFLVGFLDVCLVGFLDVCLVGFFGKKNLSFGYDSSVCIHVVTSVLTSFLVFFLLVGFLTFAVFDFGGGEGLFGKINTCRS